MLTREGFLHLGQWAQCNISPSELVHFQSHFGNRHFAVFNVSTTLSCMKLIATLAIVSRVVLEYGSSEPYDSPLYAPGVIDASSRPRFPRVVPHLPPAQSVLSQPLAALPPRSGPTCALCTVQAGLRDDKGCASYRPSLLRCWQRGV
jgi:hypothetical protein